MQSRPQSGLAGVPSCDSPELAAYRRLLTTDDVVEDYELLQAVSALLRMVDELTVQFNAERQAYNAIGRERDGLRAKLADTEETIRNERMSRDIARQATYELEAKLAEAEKRAQIWKRAAKKFYDSDYWLIPVPNELLKRAEAAEALAAKNDARAKLLLADREAAEARVRELELAVKALRDAAYHQSH